MKKFSKSCFTILFFFCLSFSANAQTFDFNKARNTPPSNLMPVLPPEDIVDTPENKIPVELGNKIYDQCLSKFPKRFTPDALQYYCSCTSAATVSTMKMSELKDMQSKDNWKLGNSSFEKYVHEVVTPCIDMPIQDMEYMSCILYRGSDWRIEKIPQYCKCFSAGMEGYVRTFAETDMMVEWGNNPKRYSTPLEALWNSSGYNDKKKEIAEHCLGSYMRYNMKTGEH